MPSARTRQQSVKNTRLIAVNELGQRIGEYHPNAKWSDEDVNQVLELRDEGLGYKRIVKATGIPRRTVRDICGGRIRCQYADRWKRVAV